MKAQKILTCTLFSSVLLGSTIFTVSTDASASSNTSASENTQVSQFVKPSELEKVIQEENLSVEELIAYGNYVQAESSQGNSLYWKGAAVKKAVKFMVDHSNIIPSKTVRNAVDKYGSKIINAIDTAETYTWYGIANALSKAGIPDKYADLIADFIVTFLLWDYD